MAFCNLSEYQQEILKITKLDKFWTICESRDEAMKVVGSIEGISFVHFDERDVVRHKLVQQIVKAYEKFSSANGSR